MRRMLIACVVGLFAASLLGGCGDPSLSTTPTASPKTPANETPAKNRFGGKTKTGTATKAVSDL